MTKKNITLDFTANNAMESVTANQPLAIMPAALAKRLLQDYSRKLFSASPREIIQPLIQSLKNCYNPEDGNSDNAVNDAVQACSDFIQERHLILNCATGNWDAFNVKEVEMERQPLHHRKLESLL